MKVLAIIPAYNEEGRVGAVVRKVIEYGVDPLVVDDGSNDATALEAEATGARVLRLPENRGKGIALRRAFDLALEEGYDGVIMIDGDGQHDPACIPDFVEKLEQGAGLVIGSRMHDIGGMPPQRVFTNTVSSYFLTFLTGKKIRDSQSGYRAMSCELIKDLRLTSTRYEVETEILLQAARLPYPFAHVPIPTIYADEESKYNAFRDIFMLFRLIARDIRSQAD
ncbi:MAG: glycosyltransferase family 2 protein [bacterium]|nr:glycosyltransferase family 2 protein [bacterium]